MTGDGSRAVSASDDGTLIVWDLESGEALRRLEGPTSWVRSVAVTADGLRAVSGSTDRTLILWDLKSGELLARFTTDGPLYGCAFGRDGTIVTVGLPHAVHILRLEGLD